VTSQTRDWRSWGIRYREAKGHAAITATILWATLLVAFVIPGDRFVTGDLKGADFVYFYTLGTVAFDGDYPRAADDEYLYARQLQLVPASSGDHHISVYPPTAALFFRPLAALPYRLAVVLWAMLTLAGYAASIFLIWRRFRRLLPDGRFTAVAAAAFPPLWYLVLYGQTTVIPLLALTLAWLAFDGHRPIAAGVAVGLLAMKPQFGLVFAVVLLAAGNWRVVFGVMLSVASQLGLVVMTMGSQALVRYAETLQQLRSVQEQLEPSPYRMHSLRVLTDQLPGGVATVMWLAMVALIVVVALMVWRSNAPLSLRFSSMVIGTVLVSPHLFVYDAAVLVIPLLLTGAWVESQRPPWRFAFWQAVYATFILFLFPTARVIRVQGSVLVMLWMFFQVQRAARRPIRTELGV